jgi:hypothetical protein
MAASNLHGVVFCCPLLEQKKVMRRVHRHTPILFEWDCFLMITSSTYERENETLCVCVMTFAHFSPRLLATLPGLKKKTNEKKGSS